MIQSIINALILGLVVLAFIRPFWAFAIILLGLFAGDRSFAYLGFTTYYKGAPLYITELVIGALCVRYLINLLKNRAKNFRKTFSPGWGLFWLAGFQSALRGLKSFPTTAVLRDASLSGYSTVSHLVVWIIEKPRQIQMFGMMAAGVLTLRAIRTLVFSNSFWPYQPAAHTMYLSIAVLFAFAFYTRWKNSVNGYTFTLLCLTSFLSMPVRSALTGFAAGCFINGFMQLRRGSPKLNVWIMPLFFLAAFTITRGIQHFQFWGQHSQWSIATSQPIYVLPPSELPFTVPEKIYQKDRDTHPRNQQILDALFNHFAWLISSRQELPTNAAQYIPLPFTDQNPENIAIVRSTSFLFDSTSFLFGSMQKRPHEFNIHTNVSGISNRSLAILSSAERRQLIIELESYGKPQPVASQTHHRAEVINKPAGQPDTKVLALPKKESVVPLVRKITDSWIKGSRVSTITSRLFVWRDRLEELPLIRKITDAWDKVFRVGTIATRFFIWQDMLEEVFLTGIGYKAYQLALYGIPVDENNFIGRKVAEELTTESPSLPLSPILQKKLSAPFPCVEERLIRIFVGVPFGKRFLPPRLIYRMSTRVGFLGFSFPEWLPFPRVERFDPHNSYIAVFFRMGMLGLISFIAIIFGAFRNAFKTSMKNVDFSGDFVIACVSSLTYCLVHASTDVTLENSYKGIFLWLFIGLLYWNNTQSEKTSKE